MINEDLEEIILMIGAFFFAGLNPDKSNPVVVWINEITAGLFNLFTQGLL